MFLGTALIINLTEVELPIGCGGVTSYQIQTNSECCSDFILAVRLGVLRSLAERGRTQTTG